MRKKVLLHLAVIFGVAALVFLYSFFGLSCPIRMLTGIPCPTCGVTRSVTALLHLDFAASFYYYPVLLPLFAAILIAVHQKVLPFKKKTCIITVVCLCSVCYIVYLIRLFTNNIP